MFPEIESPSLVLEEIDEETSLPVAEVIETTTLVERVTVSEHYLAVGYFPACQPERRAHPRIGVSETV